jgi:hypothetical protein
MTMPNHIVQIDRATLEKLYWEEGLSLTQIARVLKHDRSIISRELSRHGIPKRSHGQAVSCARRQKRPSRHVLEEMYIKQRMLQRQISAKLGVHRATILRWMKAYGIPARPKAEAITRYPKRDFSGDPVEKAYLIGFRLGDLHVKKPHQNGLTIRVDCTTTKIEQIELIKQLFGNYGHIWLSKRRADGNRLIVCFLNESFAFLLEKRDRIEEWILKSDELFAAFLAGYSDAEACIFTTKRGARFVLASYDKTILHQIYSRLQSLGITGPPPRILVPRGHIKKDGLRYRQDHWMLGIYSKKSLSKLLEMIGPHLKHKKRISDAKKARKRLGMF